MYHFISSLLTYPIQAVDGEMGKIKDIYFDDTWQIRYVIADTRRWLPERKVLLPPALFESINVQDGTIEVNSDKSTIKNSPSVPENSNLIADNENVIMRSFDWNWPNQVLVTSELNTPGAPKEDKEFEKSLSHLNEAVEKVFEKNKEDLKLRSHADIHGARIHAKDGKMGKFIDLIYSVDWEVKYIIVTKNNFTANGFYVYPIEKVNTIDWFEADVYLDETISGFEKRRAFPQKEDILVKLPSNDRLD